MAVHSLIYTVLTLNIVLLFLTFQIKQYFMIGLSLKQYPQLKQLHVRKKLFLILLKSITWVAWIQIIPFSHGKIA